jgi:hypothetical protein
MLQADNLSGKGFRAVRSSLCLPHDRRRRNIVSAGQRLGRFPIGWDRPIEKKTLQINKLEHGLINETSDISDV